MRLTLVGADLEENLGMGMIAAAATAAGHRVEVLAFNDSGQTPDLANRISSSGPDVVGLAAQFQHRGTDFLRLATALRNCGFRGHITAGGHFATMGYAGVLAGRYGVDSVVLYDGEDTIIDLLATLAAGRSLADVPGIAFCNARGARSWAPATATNVNPRETAIRNFMVCPPTFPPRHVRCPR